MLIFCIWNTASRIIAVQFVSYGEKKVNFLGLDYQGSFDI